MMNFLKNIALFFTFTAAFYCVGLLVLGNTLPRYLLPNLPDFRSGAGHNFSRLQEVKNYGEVDVLVLGSSHAYRGFDTRIFEKYGVKAFNLGSSNQTPLQTEVLLKRYLNILNPKVVLYEVYPECFSIDGLEASLDLIANDKNDKNSMTLALQHRNFKAFNLLLFSEMNRFLGIGTSQREPLEKGENTYISGGFVAKTLSYHSPKPIEPKEFLARVEQLAAFECIVEIVNNQGIQLQLVVAPVTKNDYESIANFSEYDFLFKKNAKYINFNEELVLDDSLHFYDKEHLNQAGVEFFMPHLLKSLNF